MEIESNNSSGSNYLKVNQEEEGYDLEILLRRPSLRTNVRRKSSQTYSNIIKTKETTCGIACLQGEWLQSFSNRTSFLFIYGALSYFYGSFNTYFYGSITTLEKRFQLTSQSIGIIASTNDFVHVIMCLVLSFCNIKNHRPRWIGMGIFLIFLSALIWSLTNFLCDNINSVSRENKNSTSKLITSEDVYDDEMQDIMAIIYLSSAQILNGIGGSLFFVLGSTYIEDNNKDYPTLSILNLLLALKTVGLAFGYWLSSLCLKIFLQFKTPTSYIPYITQDEPNWIGAWWFGSLMVGFFIIIPGFLISLYPTSMPKTVIKRLFNGISKNEETKESCKVLDNDKNISTFSLHSNNYSGIYNVFRFAVYFIFITKYVEIQYQISSSEANFTVGTIPLLCSALGTVLAGSFASKYKPDAIYLIAWNFTTGILSIACLIYYIFLGCDNYESQIKSLILQYAAISSNANFKTSKISYPDSVCDEFGQTFLSLQMIGCLEILTDNQTIICKIINKNLTDFNVMKTVYKGPCHADCQSEFFKFIIITCLMSFIYGSGKISNFLIYVKENNNLKSLQLLNWGVFLNLLTFIPVPMLFGHFLDISCIFWNNNESQTGNCWLYDVQNVRLFFNLTAVAFVIVGIISDTLVLLSVKNLKMSYNEIDE